MTAPRVVVDTNVWGAEVRSRTDDLRRRYAKHLAGVAPSIAAQTAAELRYGALSNNWGPSRTRKLERLLSRAGIIPVDEQVIQANAELRDACRRIGHALHDKVHTGDLWIAASALVHDLPLITDDGIFVGVPGLTIIREES